MAQPVVVVVTASNQASRELTGALQQQLAVRPTVFDSGRAAVLWLGANQCDAVVLDYMLPEVSGIEALLSIKQRKPNIPVLMFSDADSERAAVDAFHSGVTDYVPKRPGYDQAIARILDQVLDQGAESVVPAQMIDPSIPDQLIQLTYQNRLRTIGRHLDIYGYRTASILEVAGGFLVRAVPAGNRQPEALEFADQHFPQIIATAIAARGEGERRSRSTSALLPTGYEDFLRAIGFRLDEHVAEAVTINELDQFVAVGGVGKIEEYERTRVGPMQWLLRSDEVTYLLDEAYRRRKPAQQEASEAGGSRFRRFIGNQ